MVEEFETNGAFLTEYPLNLLQFGKYHQIPLLFLYTKREAIVLEIFLNRRGIPIVHSDFENYVPKTLKLKKGSKESKSLAEEIKRFYYGEKQPSTETKDEYYNVSSKNILY